MCDLNVDCDSASCSSVSSTEDTSVINRSPAESVSRASVSSMQNVQMSTADAERMVHPTVNTASPSSGAARHRRSRCLSQSSSSESDSREKPSRRKRQKDKLSPEEEEKRRLRRERNKIAAAKCRNRRRELTERLQSETDKLEEEKATLQTEIDNLMREKAQLEMVLSAHEPTCKMTNEEEEEEEEEMQMQQSPPSPQQPLPPVFDPRKAPEVPPSLQDLEMHSSGMSSTTAILGNSNILLCSSAVAATSELEAFLGVKEESLRDLGTEVESGGGGHDVAPAVPDIDLTNSLGISDWETLYKSMADNLEILNSPTVIASPTCSSSLQGFEFNYPDFDSFTDDCECGSQIKSRSDMVKDILNSPTLLAL